jgi:hypothetical protein
MTICKAIYFDLCPFLTPGSNLQNIPCFRVFHWPKDMAAVFDLAKTRIGNKRDQVEDALRDRVDKFETKVFIQNIFGDFDPI